MIEKRIQESTTPSRFSMPMSAPKKVKNEQAIHVAALKRCGGCGQVLVDDNCPDCNKVVVL